MPLPTTEASLHRPPPAPFSPAERAAPAGTSPLPEVERREAFRSALEKLGRAIDRGEMLVRRVSAGGVGTSLSAGELIALQAGIYRYSEAVDLAAKLVDRASNAARTVVQSNG